MNASDRRPVASDPKAVGRGRLVRRSIKEATA